MQPLSQSTTRTHGPALTADRDRETSAMWSFSHHWEYSFYGVQLPPPPVVAERETCPQFRQVLNRLRRTSTSTTTTGVKPLFDVRVHIGFCSPHPHVQKIAKPPHSACPVSRAGARGLSCLRRASLEDFSYFMHRAMHPNEASSATPCPTRATHAFRRRNRTRQRSIPPTAPAPASGPLPPPRRRPRPPRSRGPS